MHCRSTGSSWWRRMVATAASTSSGAPSPWKEDRQALARDVIEEKVGEVVRGDLHAGTLNRSTRSPLTSSNGVTSSRTPRSWLRARKLVVGGRKLKRALVVAVRRASCFVRVRRVERPREAAIDLALLELRRRPRRPRRSSTRGGEAEVAVVVEGDLGDDEYRLPHPSQRSPTRARTPPATSQPPRSASATKGSAAPTWRGLRPQRRGDVRTASAARVTPMRARLPAADRRAVPAPATPPPTAIAREFRTFTRTVKGLRRALPPARATRERFGAETR